MGGDDSHPMVVAPHAGIGAVPLVMPNGDLAVVYRTNVVGVPEPARQPGYPVPVHHAIGDEPHRAAHHVGPVVPLGRTGGGVRAAAQAGPEPLPLRRVPTLILPNSCRCTGK